MTFNYICGLTTGSREEAVLISLSIHNENKNVNLNIAVLQTKRIDFRMVFPGLRATSPHMNASLKRLRRWFVIHESGHWNKYVALQGFIFISVFFLVLLTVFWRVWRRDLGRNCSFMRETQRLLGFMAKLYIKVNTVLKVCFFRLAALDFQEKPQGWDEANQLRVCFQIDSLSTVGLGKVMLGLPFAGFTRHRSHCK